MCIWTKFLAAYIYLKQIPFLLLILELKLANWFL